MLQKVQRMMVPRATNTNMRSGPLTAPLTETVVDCRDPLALATFSASVLDYDVVRAEGGRAQIAALAAGVSRTRPGRSAPLPAPRLWYAVRTAPPDPGPRRPPQRGASPGPGSRGHAQAADLRAFVAPHRLSDCPVSRDRGGGLMWA